MQKVHAFITARSLHIDVRINKLDAGFSFGRMKNRYATS